MKSLVLFNNKGGVGKTTLTFHLAHMISRLGKRVALLDDDPQSNLTAMLVDEDDLVELVADPGSPSNVAGCLEPVRKGRGEIPEPALTVIADDLWLLPGSLALSRFEQTVAEE